MTPNGGHVADIFMSLIHTCQLNEVDPRCYVTRRRHAAEIATFPEKWMPWNYRQARAGGGPPPALVN